MLAASRIGLGMSLDRPEDSRHSCQQRGVLQALQHRAQGSACAVHRSDLTMARAGPPPPRKQTERPRRVCIYAYAVAAGTSNSRGKSRQALFKRATKQAK